MKKTQPLISNLIQQIAWHRRLLLSINGSTGNRVSTRLTLFCSAVALVMPLCLWHSTAPTSAARPDAAPTVLHGESALSQLKGQGSYASLQAAVQAARYSAARTSATPLNRGAYYVHNPSHRLTAYFTPQGLHLETEQQQIDLRFRGIGYGARRQRMTEGTVQASDNRVEIHRHLQADSGERAEPGSLIEWYVNRPAGLEHGFTINAAVAMRSASSLSR